VSVIAIDQVAGAVAATRHLLEHGHRTVWHIAGPDGWLEARARVHGWQSALHEAGAVVPCALTGDWSARSGYELARQLIADGGVTAIFAANDHMALGVLRCLHENGIAVPHDISLVGFDDIPEAAFFTPPLTTVRQDFGEMGRLSVLELLGRIDGDDWPARRVTVDAQLVVRESTRPT
jgi:DNA-binding LacI/PurR family transcriptional regulator